MRLREYFEVQKMLNKKRHLNESIVPNELDSDDFSAWLDAHWEELFESASMSEITEWYYTTGGPDDYDIDPLGMGWSAKFAKPILEKFDLISIPELVEGVDAKRYAEQIDSKGAQPAPQHVFGWLWKFLIRQLDNGGSDDTKYSFGITFKNKKTGNEYVLTVLIQPDGVFATNDAIYIDDTNIKLGCIKQLYNELNSLLKKDNCLTMAQAFDTLKDTYEYED